MHRLSTNAKGTNLEGQSNMSSVNEDQAVEGAEAIAPGQQSNIENKKDLLRAKSFNLGKMVTNDPHTPLSKVLQQYDISRSQSQGMVLTQNEHKQLLEMMSKSKGLSQVQGHSPDYFGGVSNAGNVTHSNNARGGNRSANNSLHKASYEENVPPSARSGINSIHGPNLQGVHRAGAMQGKMQGSSANGPNSTQNLQTNKEQLMLSGQTQDPTKMIIIS